MSDLKPYNLPGFGVLRPTLFPHAQALYDFLAGAKFIRRLEVVDQLGALRGVYPGAHHSRLEYVMAQLAIVTEICRLSGPQLGGLGLSSDASGFTKLTWLPKAPSYGEIVQVMVLLANAGHLHNTFSAERALLKYLRDNRGARAAFRSGLHEADQDRYDHVLDAFQTYRLHLFIILFLLRRYRKRQGGHELAAFGTAVVRSFMTSSDPAGGDMASQWRYFKAIRRFTYLALDALYTPVPFSLDLASIFLSLRSDGPAALDPDSVFQRALVGLETVMRDSVYLAPEALLQHSRASDRILTRLDAEQVQHSITGLKALLSATEKSLDVFARVDTAPKVEATPQRTVVLSYERDEASDAALIPDPMQWEREQREAVAYRSCRFAAEWNPPGNHLRIAAGIGSDLDANVEKRLAFRIGRQLALVNSSFQAALKVTPLQEWTNQGALFRFLLGAVFGWDLRYRLVPAPLPSHRGVVLCEGSTRAGRLVEQLTTRDAAWDDDVSADRHNEMVCVAQALKTMKHRGLVMAFFGSTEVLSDERSVAQFDGVICRFNTQPPYGSLVLVEAKNAPNGHTLARAQLELRTTQLGNRVDRGDMTDLSRRGAFCVLHWT